METVKKASKVAVGFTETVVDEPAFKPVKDPLARLKEPFREDQHKQGRVDSTGFVGTFVEWYDICDRIEEVDPNWQHEVKVDYLLVGSKVIVSATASIQILGVTRMGHASTVTTSATIGRDGKATETSSLQRAASKFGLTRYLYRGGREEPRLPLTEEQREAVQRAADHAAGDDGIAGDADRWVTGIVGRDATVNGTFTAAELEIILLAGANGE